MNTEPDPEPTTRRPQGAPTYIDLQNNRYNWQRFLKDEDEIVTTDHNVLTLKIAWVIDLMVLFIERAILRSQRYSPFRFQYAEHIVVDSGYQKTAHRVPNIDFSKFQSYVYLVTCNHGTDEPTGIIFVEDNVVEVFMPFKQFKDNVKRVASNIQQTHGAARIVTYNTDNNGNNGWTIYFLLLRLQYPMISTDHILRSSNRDALDKQVNLSFIRIAKLILNCLEKHSDASAKNSRQQLLNMSLTKDQRPLMARFFGSCKMQNKDFDWLTDLEPNNQHLTTKWDPKYLEMKKWVNFVPVEDATDPIYHFVKS
jgi:hypothetical protein